MPANRVIETFGIGPFSSVEAFHSTTLQHPGELGMRAVTTANKEYQLVLLDSGATAATPAGILAVGQSVYWKNKATYTVTNDSRFAIGGQTTHGWRNEVAGVAMVAAVAGEYFYPQTKGACATVKIVSSSPAAGDQLISDTSATAAQMLPVAAGTALVCVGYGKVAVGGTSVTSIAAELDVPDIP